MVRKEERLRTKMGVVRLIIGEGVVVVVVVVLRNRSLLVFVLMVILLRSKMR